MNRQLTILSRKLVGARGFEPPAFCSQSRRATGLRHAPRYIAVPSFTLTCSAYNTHPTDCCQVLYIRRICIFSLLYQGRVSQCFLSARTAFPLKCSEFYNMITHGIADRFGDQVFATRHLSLLSNWSSATPWWAIPSKSRGTTPTSRRLE
jgi:hypothetical protein